MVMKNIKNTISMLKELDQEELKGWRMVIIFFIVINMFLFYWYMEWKKFSIAVMVVSLIALAIILMLERKYPPEVATNDSGSESKKLLPVFKQPKEENTFGINLSIPDADSYNDRLSKAND